MKRKNTEEKEKKIEEYKGRINGRAGEGSEREIMLKE